VPPPSTGAVHATMPHRVMPGQVRFTDLNGATVYDPEKHSVGDINNVVLDRDGKVAAVVIKTGGVLGIGGKTVAVAMDRLKVSNGSNGKPHFAIGMTKQQLESAQAYSLTPSSNAAATGTGSSTPPNEHTRQ
jgi:sporulation protein YlmC with PRC-barrel domain